MPDSKPNPNPRAYARRLREAVENREPGDAPELRAPLDPNGTTSEMLAALHRRYALVETVLEAARANPPEADLADAVLAALQADTSRPASTRPVPTPTVRAAAPVRPVRYTGWMLAAVAATLLVALVVLRRPIGTSMATDTLAEGTNRTITNPESDTVAGPGATTPNEDPANEIDRLFAEVSAAYRGFADETRVAVADLGGLVARATNEEPTPVQDSVAPTGWLERVGGGFVPVRENVGRTLDFLLEPIPDPTTT